MELTVREAATLLGRSGRTVRAQVARGEIPAVKKNGQWRIARHSLPLTEAQRRTLQGKADALRQTVESALSSRLAQTPGQRSRSVADLDAFRSGARLLGEMRAASDGNFAPFVRDRVARLVERALLSLAEAVFQFDREIKLAALLRTRASLARAVALLLIEAGIPPAEPVLGWVVALETEVIPAVAGFAVCRRSSRCRRPDGRRLAQASGSRRSGQ